MKRQVGWWIGILLLSGLSPVHPQPRLGSAAQSYYLPAVGSTGGRFAGLAITNLSPTSGKIRVHAYNSTGLPLIGDVPLRSEFDVAGGSSVRLLDHDVLGVPPAQVPAGWLRIESLGAEFAIDVQQGEEGLRRLDGFALIREPVPDLILPHVYQGEGTFQGQDTETLLHVVNPNPQAVQLQLRLFAGGGGKVPSSAGLASEGSFIVPAFGRLSGTLADLLGATGVASGHLRISSSSSLGLVASAEIRFLQGRSTVLTPAISPAAGSNGFLNLAFQTDDFLDSGYPSNSRLRLVHTGTGPRTVELHAFSVEEELELPPFVATLMSGQSVEADIDDLFELPDAPEDELLHLALRLTVYGGAGVVGDILLYDPDDVMFATDVPFETRLFTRAAFGELSTLADPFSHLALTNPGPDPAELTIQAFDRHGGLLRERQISLDPDETFNRDVGLIFFPILEVDSGYLVVTSDRPIFGSMVLVEIDAEWLTTVAARVEEQGELFPFHQPDICLGDVAATGLVGPGLLPQDGIRDENDVDLLLKVIVATEFLRGFRLMSADVNQDGEIDVLDAVRLLQHIHGLRLLPDCGPAELDFFPSQLPNLEVWLLPEPLTMFQDLEETEPVEGDGDLVAVWKDQSGNQNDFIQEDPDRQPEFQEELVRTVGGVTFDGVDDLLEIVEGSAAEVGSFYAVVRWEEPLSSYGIVLGHGTRNGGLLMTDYIRDFSLYQIDELYDFLWFDGVKLPRVPALHEPRRWFFTLPGSLLSFNVFRADQVLPGEVEINSIGSRRDGTHQWLGTVVELVVYSDQKTEMAGALVDRYFQRRYGVRLLN